MKRFSQLICLWVMLCLNTPALAWDSVGHRLSAAVALHFLDRQTSGQLMALVAEHPRYEEDFLARIPGFVERGDTQALNQWLLGQAAYWPDIARGLPQPAERRFNRPTWHYIDGAWVRDSAAFQGNVYVGREAFADIQGPSADSIDSEAEVEDIVTALDYNTRLLADPGQPAPARAVALCWVLHLMGDIHQPLHTGSLYSPGLFARGDRGGNAIPTGESNLHAVWDRALRREGVAGNFDAVLEQLGGFSARRLQGVASDWTDWMSESRQLLRSSVYSDPILAAIREADAGSRSLAPLELDQAYYEQMRSHARLRIGLAGLRLAIWFENELP